VVISAEVGVRKPDPRIYELGARAIGLEPAACVFVDDLPGNLKPARELGMATVHHTDAQDTVPQLERLLGVRLR
jgi:epoxide hydrolase-like predicted phosphatase